MRDIIITSVLFSLLLIAIVFNSCFVNSGSEKMVDMVDDLPDLSSPSCKKAIDDLSDAWHSFRKVAVLSLNYNEISKIDCLIDELSCHIQTGNKNDFEHAKVMIRNMLREISRLEKISADGVF